MIPLPIFARISLARGAMFSAWCFNYVLSPCSSNRSESLFFSECETLQYAHIYTSIYNFFIFLERCKINLCIFLQFSMMGCLVARDSLVVLEVTGSLSLQTKCTNFLPPLKILRMRVHTSPTPLLCFRVHTRSVLRCRMY